MVCGGEGVTAQDFICGECGDPRETMLYCERCGRRLRLDEGAAAALLREHGFDDRDLRGLVFKVTACSVCMTDDETADIVLYRIRLG